MMIALLTVLALLVVVPLLTLGQTQVQSGLTRRLELAGARSRHQWLMMIHLIHF